MAVIITKKIAKQGKNLVLIIPRNLHHLIRGGDLVEVRINKLPVMDMENQKE